MEKRYALLSADFNLEGVAARMSAGLRVKPEEVWAKGKIVETGSVLCYWAVREFGMPMPFASHKDWGYQSHRSAIQSPAAKRFRRQRTAVCSKPKNLTASPFTLET